MNYAEQLAIEIKNKSNMDNISDEELKAFINKFCKEYNDSVKNIIIDSGTWEEFNMGVCLDSIDELLVFQI